MGQIATTPTDAAVPPRRAAQIADELRQRIRSGLLRTGERLPTIRALAQTAGVTRATVQAAFRLLQREGLIESMVGRGTVVAGQPAAGGAPAAGGPALSRAAHAALRALQDTSPRLDARWPDDGIDLAGLQPDPELFPLEAFRECVDRVLSSAAGSVAALGYGDTAGDPGLRRVLAARHGDGDPQRVLVTSGAQQGIELVIRTFASPGDAVAVALPTYHQLLGALAAHGVELVPIEAPDGIADPAAVAAALARPDVRLLYVMPSFHNPTGATLDTAQRRALMEVVARTDVPVLEDEFEGELRFAGAEPPSLAQLDPRHRTITVRTFSKALFPGLRIGWIEAPVELVAPLRALKRFSDLESSPLIQAALREFVQDGALDRYLDVLRAELRERHAVADATLRAELPVGSRWLKPDGGLAMWLELPATLDADQVAQRAAERGLLVTPGRLFDPFDRPSRGLRLAFSRASTDTIRRGVAILGATVRELLAARDGSAMTSTPLIL